jgi:hypothetical protein
MDQIKEILNGSNVDSVEKNRVELMLNKKIEQFVDSDADPEKQVCPWGCVVGFYLSSDI